MSRTRAATANDALGNWHLMHLAAQILTHHPAKKLAKTYFVNRPKLGGDGAKFCCRAFAISTHFSSVESTTSRFRDYEDELNFAFLMSNKEKQRLDRVRRENEYKPLRKEEMVFAVASFPPLLNTDLKKSFVIA
jgi:hypothetical protein